MLYLTFAIATAFALQPLPLRTRSSAPSFGDTHCLLQEGACYRGAGHCRMELQDAASASSASTPAPASKTVDMRRQGMKNSRAMAMRKRADSQVGDGYGRDPRLDYKGNARLAATVGSVVPTAVGSQTGPPAEPAGIGVIKTVDDLEAALERARLKDDRPVVLKFFATTCVSCQSIKPKYKRLARDNSHRADFYEVETLAARAFIKQCDVRYMPAGHIYVGGKLQAAISMGKKSYNVFVDTLETAMDAAESGAKPPAETAAAPVVVD